ncbi:unnamed protein product, partial [Prorocentrum cordatum]
LEDTASAISELGDAAGDTLQGFVNLIDGYSAEAKATVIREVQEVMQEGRLALAEMLRVQAELSRLTTREQAELPRAKQDPPSGGGVAGRPPPRGRREHPGCEAAAAGQARRRHVGGSPGHPGHQAGAGGRVPEAGRRRRRGGAREVPPRQDGEGHGAARCPREDERGDAVRPDQQAREAYGAPGAAGRGPGGGAAPQTGGERAGARGGGVLQPEPAGRRARGLPGDEPLGRRGHRGIAERGGPAARGPPHGAADRAGDQKPSAAPPRCSSAPRPARARWTCSGNQRKWPRTEVLSRRAGRVLAKAKASLQATVAAL